MLHASSVDFPSWITYPQSFAPSTGSLLNKGLPTKYFSLLRNLWTYLSDLLQLYQSMFLPVNSAHPLIAVCFAFLLTAWNLLVAALFLSPPSIWFCVILPIGPKNSPLSTIFQVLCVDTHTHSHTLEKSKKSTNPPYPELPTKTSKSNQKWETRHVPCAQLGLKFVSWMSL